MSSTTPAGWHPDPSNPGGTLRWWDGSAWTAHTHPAVAAPAPSAQFGAAAPSAHFGAPAAQFGASAPAAQFGAPPPAWANHQAAYQPGYAPAVQAPPVSFAKRNSLSLTAAGVVVLYVVVALSLHIVFLGIFPVILCVRAIGRKEPLAPVAVVAAVVAIAVALLALA